MNTTEELKQELKKLTKEELLALFKQFGELAGAAKTEAEKLSFFVAQPYITYELIERKMLII